MNRTGLFHPLLIFSAMIACMFVPQVLSGHAYFIRDITYLFQPWEAAAAQAIQSGQLPLWNHYAFCGMPFIGNWQTAVFYPFSMLFTIFPFPTALPLFQATQLFIGGLFAYLFLRQRGISANAAGAGMLVFAFSGYVMMRLEFISHLSATVWLFSLVLFLPCWWALATAFAICLLGGHPSAIICIILACGYTFVFGPLGTLPDRLLSLTRALAAAALLAAIQLLPVVDLAQKTARVAEGILSVDAFAHAVTMRGLATIISPFLQDSATPRIFGELFAWSNTVSIGAIATILALFGIFIHQRSHRALAVTALMAILIGSLISLGAATPVYPWLFAHLPGMASLRYPAQFFLIATAGLAVLAAIGAERIGSSRMIVMLIGAELLLSFYFFQPTAPATYFHEKAPVAAYLQSQEESARFILSPATQLNHRMTADASVQAPWQQARSYLHNLTCIPYHLHNAYGLGEPLVPASVETMVTAAYTATTPQLASPLYRELGVQYLLCRTRLNDETGYSLQNSEEPYIYRIDDADGIESCDPAHTARVIRRSEYWRGVQYEISAIAPALITVRITAMPGWHLYVNGREQKIEMLSTGFMRFAVQPGITRAWLRYTPASGIIGLWATLLTALSLAVYAGISLRKTL